MSLTDEELKKFPEWKQKRLKSKYGNNPFVSPKPTYDDLADIDERLRDLEYKVFRTARKEITTRAQQMLLLRDLGLLEKLDELNLSGKKKAQLLSILLNASADNIREDLSHIHRKDYKQINAENYQFLFETYKAIGLKELAESTDQVLDKLKAKK